MLRSAAITLLLGLGAALAQTPAAQYDVHATRFASVPYQVRNLVTGAEAGRSINIAFTIWARRDQGRVVLVDAGFYRDKFKERWKPQDFVKPSDALMTGLGVAPAAVTDIILTHSHWDHADGVDLFPNARIWIQKDEYNYYIGENGTVAHSGGADTDDAKVLFALHSAGRVSLVDGDAKEILPGISVYTGGKHTFQSQFVSVRTAAGVVILASDNAYLYENLEKKLPIAQTLDAASNLAAQARMFQLAASPKFVIPGHDPAVFERFPTPGNGVALIAK
jgi:glyoxylase-like metal-dependent hydrolase (beta-lactamase superfamily II)